MRGLDAGSLDRRITIERLLNRPSDDFNNPVLRWAPIATVWASKEDVRDSERIAAQEVGAEISTRFQIRWSELTATVTPKDRIFFESKYFNISAVKEIGRRQGLEITASARADEGPSEGGG